MNRFMLDSDTLHRFCKVLDGSKSGAIVKRATRSSDAQQFFKRSPLWMEERKKSKYDSNNNLHPIRQISGTFIMDNIRNHMDKEINTARDKVHGLYRKFHRPPMRDPVLTMPYQTAFQEAQMRDSKGYIHTKQELEVIRKRVESCYNNWQARIVNRKFADKRFTSLPIERRQDILRSLSQEFTILAFREHLSSSTAEAGALTRLGEFSPPELERIMASYLYKLDFETNDRPGKKPSRAPWDMAFKTLCDIKADSKGGRKILLSTYEKLTVHQVYRLAIGSKP
jgi:RNA-dependent RNA polymerase